MDTQDLTPALIDEKDVCSDFDFLFDHNQVIYRTNCALGYIGDNPVECEWDKYTNVLTLFPLEGSSHVLYNDLIMIVEDAFDETSPFIVEVEERENGVAIEFWWRK